jgi:hypothetical protein
VFETLDKQATGACAWRWDFEQPHEDTSMTDAPRPNELPDYDAPPVDEVAIGVQFRPIAGYSNALVGAFRETVQASDDVA